jgi:hypothetical protein
MLGVQVEICEPSSNPYLRCELAVYPPSSWWVELSVSINRAEFEARSTMTNTTTSTSLTGKSKLEVDLLCFNTVHTSSTSLACKCELEGISLLFAPPPPPSHTKVSWRFIYVIF